MKRHLLRSLAVAVLLMMAVSAMAQRGPETPQVQAPVAAEGLGLSGAWKGTITPEEGGPPPFSVLMLFMRDGGVVETDAGPPNPLQFSPGLGEWKRAAQGHFIISYTQLQYDGGQNQIGVFRGTMDVTVDHDTVIAGTANVAFYDLDDTLLFEGAGTVKFTRP
jgi:hypothetical protein